jgi:DNA polymerase/3'-5' exonuclease PolX
MDYKDLIIQELDVLRRTSASENAGVFKSRQYATAIKTIRELPHVHTVDDVPTTKGNGIGEKIREKIVEILATGHLQAADRARATKAPDSLEAFTQVYGVGPKKAADLVKAGYKTIADLRTALQQNQKLLNKNQQIGLRHYEDILERIPRSEMETHERTLMAAKPAELQGTIVGSFRRGNKDSGDIDMLLCSTAPNVGEILAAYVKTLKAQGYITDVLAQGDSKCLAVCRLPNGGKARRLDLLITPPEEYGFAVLYFTGSDGFNVRMRQHALERGYTLNEHALTGVNSGKKVLGIRTEQDVFTALKLQWKEPTERTGPEAVIPYTHG